MKQGDRIELTKTEYDLLEYLLVNKGLVLTRDQIVEHDEIIRRLHRGRDTAALCLL